MTAIVRYLFEDLCQCSSTITYMDMWPMSTNFKVAPSEIKNIFNMKSDIVMPRAYTLDEVGTRA